MQKKRTKDYKMEFKEFISKKEELTEDYKSDTKKYIDSVLDSVDDSVAKKFLNGLKKFVDENGYLTGKQRSALSNVKKD